MLTRRLSLRREALADLTAEELGSVAGGRDHTIPDPGCVVAETLRITAIVTDGGIALTSKCTT